MQVPVALDGNNDGEIYVCLNEHGYLCHSND